MIRHRRTADTSESRLVLLAPRSATVPSAFLNLQFDAVRHEQLLAGMQRLRGSVYLQDAAIGRQELSADGRHVIGIDWDSWHLLAVDRSGAVCGSVRYRAHGRTAGFQDLWVRHSALADDPDWGSRFRCAVESEQHQARSRNVSYVEVGGWAVAPARRCTTDPLRIALATFGLAQILGGCIGITTATVKHSSSSILRRIGGTSLEFTGQALPPYYDPRFKCDMEVLRFDSACPAPKCLHLVDRFRAEILESPVICARMLQLPRPRAAQKEAAERSPALAGVLA
jgi:hypothetical protein